VTRYRIRWPVVLGSTLPVPLLCGVLIALPFDNPVRLVIGLLTVVVATAISAAKVRRRSLEVGDDGLVEQRDDYRLHVPWDSITGVQRRRHQVVVPVEELLSTGARMEPVDSRGQTRTPRDGMEEYPALTRVMVSLYDKDWRSGPIGQRVSHLDGV
jgi:hypothetical protein